NLDLAISDLANRTARIVRFTPFEIGHAARAWSEWIEAARRSFAFVDWKDPKNLLLPAQIPLSIGAMFTGMGLRGLCSFEIIGAKRFPVFISNAFEMFTEAQIYVTVQYEPLLARYEERLKEAPDDSSNRVEYGRALIKCGRYPEAVRILQPAVQDP